MFITDIHTHLSYYHTNNLTLKINLNTVDFYCVTPESNPNCDVFDAKLKSYIKNNIWSLLRWVSHWRFWVSSKNTRQFVNCSFYSQISTIWKKDSFRTPAHSDWHVWDFEWQTLLWPSQWLGLWDWLLRCPLHRLSLHNKDHIGEFTGHRGQNGRRSTAPFASCFYWPG